MTVNLVKLVILVCKGYNMASEIWGSKSENYEGTNDHEEQLHRDREGNSELIKKHIIVSKR